jgi:hypothetical protein
VVDVNECVDASDDRCNATDSYMLGTCHTSQILIQVWMSMRHVDVTYLFSVYVFYGCMCLGPHVYSLLLTLGCSFLIMHGAIVDSLTDVAVWDLMT